jgi:hypothetical protein
LVIDSGFTKFSLWALSYYITGGGSVSLSSSTPSVFAYGLPENMNTTGVIRSFIVISGINVTLSDTTNTFDIDVVGSWIGPNGFKVTVSTTSTTPLVIHGLNFVSFSYN